MGTRALAVAAIQASFGHDMAANIAKVESLVREAARKGAQVVLPPELFQGIYFPTKQDPKWFATAYPVNEHPCVLALGKLAKELGVVIPISFFEKDGPRYFNSVAIAGASGEILGVYRKSHIPDGPGYMEKYYFRPGDTGFRAWRAGASTIGVGICWDQWYPEAARALVLEGAEILFYPTAIGWHPSERKQYGEAQHDSWEVMMRSHAVANGCFVAAPNRIGHEIIKDTKGKPVDKDGIVFWGQSFVASPDGQVIQRAPVNKEAVMVVDCDLARVEFSRTHWPFLRDRRIDAYGNLTKRLAD
jgi:N-carbamoylputrescine amidase